MQLKLKFNSYLPLFSLCKISPDSRKHFGDPLMGPQVCLFICGTTALLLTGYNQQWMLSLPTLQGMCKENLEVTRGWVDT